MDKIELAKIALAGVIVYLATKQGPVPLEDMARTRHGQAFVDATYEIERRYQLPKGSLFSVFYSESGMNPAAGNPGSGAAGLIQFMGSTLNSAKYGFITVEQMRQLSALQQLHYVDIFYKGWYDRGKRPKSPAEVYLLTFYPYAVGQPNNFVLGSEVSNARAQQVRNANRPFDVDGDGYITIANFKQYLRTATRLKDTIFQK